MTSKYTKKLLPFTLAFVAKQKWLFLGTQICALAWTLDATIWPLIYASLIDHLTNHMGDRSQIFSVLAPLFLAGIVLWLVLEVGFRMGGFLWAKAIPRLEADVRFSLLEYVQKHSYSYFSNHFAGALANKMNDLPSSLNNILNLIIFLFIPVLCALVIGITVFFTLSPLFALLLTLWISVHLFISFYFARKCNQLSHVHAEARSTLSGKIVDSISNYSNVKLFSRYNYELNYLKDYQNKEIKTHWAALWYVEKVKILLAIASFILNTVLITWAMISYWQAGLISNGDVVLILNTSWNITMMAWFAGLELPNFFKEIGVANQALTLMQHPHEIVDQKDSKELIVCRGEIRFENVSFRYNDGKILFEDKSVVIKPGEKIGLVGFSGSGKTSFINLILRQFDLTKGRILIDGQDIAKVTQDSLRRSIAMIPQEPILFHRTLKENIRYGKLDATDDEVIAAAKKAHCHEFIMKLPLQYETLVGERGIKLSGGQRQRIGIARAVIKDAPILILDEATSSLDSVTEKHIQHDLIDLMRGRTSIVIAHRLSTIAHLDKIMVFDQGKVVEEGTHDELLQMNGRYAAMWGMQAGGFLPSDNHDEENPT